VVQIFQVDDRTPESITGSGPLAVFNLVNSSHSLSVGLAKTRSASALGQLMVMSFRFFTKVVNNFSDMSVCAHSGFSVDR
jgi:hypothetical protein